MPSGVFFDLSTFTETLIRLVVTQPSSATSSSIVSTVSAVQTVEMSSSRWCLLPS